MFFLVKREYDLLLSYSEKNHQLHLFFITDETSEKFLLNIKSLLRCFYNAAPIDELLKIVNNMWCYSDRTCSVLHKGSVFFDTSALVWFLMRDFYMKT